MMLLANSLLLAVGGLLQESPFVLESISPHFFDPKNIIDNPHTFYQELQLAPHTDPAAFCPLLQHFQPQNATLKSIYYLAAASKTLGCRADPALAVEAALQDIHSQSFASYFYAFKILQTTGGDADAYCGRLGEFYAGEGKFSPSTARKSSSYYYTAVAAEIAQHCAERGREGAVGLKRLLEEAQLGCERPSGDAAFLAADAHTFFATLRLTNALLASPEHVLDAGLVSRLMGFLGAQLPLTLDSQLKLEYNRFLRLREAADVVALPAFIDLELCGQECRVATQPPRARRLAFRLGAERLELQSNAEGEFLIARRLLEGADPVAVEPAAASGPTHLPAGKVRVFSRNRLQGVRVAAGERATAQAMAEGGLGSCDAVEVEASQDDFLNVSFRLERAASFVFVQLWPEAALEKSTPVLASRDEKSGTYFAALDLGDYEVIRPNAGGYSLVVAADELAGVKSAPKNLFVCGKLRLSFRNAAPAAKRLPSDPRAVPEQFRAPEAPRPQPGLALVAYFSLLAAAFYGLFLAVLARHFARLAARPTPWQACVLATVALAVGHTLYLAARRLLIERVWQVLGEVALFTLASRRAFAL